MQIGPRLLYRHRVGFKHPHEGVVGQVLGLLAISQPARPGSDQLFVMLEKSACAGQLGGHHGVLWWRERE
ncbi:hypothetical protein D3C76_1596740 [compost metagenome]